MKLRGFFLAAVIAALGGQSVHAYYAYGSKWTSPSITMHLQLGSSSGVLLDGFTSWGASAEDALNTWNSQIGASKFTVVRDSTVGRVAGNRVNNVHFSNTIDGEAWGTGVLAVTIIYSSGSSQVETDVLFNNLLSWNSYRGAKRTSPTGGTLHDFHRVALHEFGHALGLDHPDEIGQTVSALMNSTISALDALTSDDIAGAQSLYGSTTPVIVAPIIVTQPSNRSVVVGQNATFAVVANSAAPLSYQWRKGGVPIPGATGASFTLSSPTLDDSGSYSVVVSNSSGSVTSNSATLIVTASTTPTTPTNPTSPVVGPGIATAPASQSANAGTTVSLYVIATGTPPFSYQWRKDGTPLASATTTVLSIPNVQLANAGSYSVTIANSAGTVTSTPAILTVNTLPTIVTPPADQTVPVGALLRLSVVATGSSAYAWRKNGVNVPGATNQIYQVAQAQSSDAGSYVAVVMSPAGSVTSTAARVTVTAAPPTVTAMPVAQTAKAGESVTFSVTATGTGALTYQWSKDGQEISGAADRTLTLPAVQVGDAGNYSVRISNSAGSTTTPAVALTVKSSRLINLSSRAFVPAGGTLTPGFFVRGQGSKLLLIRAVGPTLQFFGIAAALPEARLEVVAQDGTTSVSGGESRQLTDSEIAANVGAFPLQPGAKDAVAQANLSARGYTVRISPGNATMMGVTLAEIYDADSPLSRAQLVNVSTLGFVGYGENVLTAGFVISGNAPKRLLVRGVGPGLVPFGVSGVLADPQIALLRQGAAEPLAMNDNWPVDDVILRNAVNAAGAFILPADSRDAALVVTLEPGAYTVIVSSVTASVTGQALVEIYDLDP